MQIRKGKGLGVQPDRKNELVVVSVDVLVTVLVFVLVTNSINVVRNKLAKKLASSAK